MSADNSPSKLKFANGNYYSSQYGLQHGKPTVLSYLKRETKLINKRQPGSWDVGRST